MEVAVVIQPLNGVGFRAATGDPLPAAAEGISREDALGKLRAILEERMRTGAEFVRLRIAGPAPAAATPIWPDDDLTRDWLAGIADVRRAADEAPEHWAESPGPAAP